MSVSVSSILSRTRGPTLYVGEECRGNCITGPWVICRSRICITGYDPPYACACFSRYQRSRTARAQSLTQSPSIHSYVNLVLGARDDLMVSALSNYNMATLITQHIIHGATGKYYCLGLCLQCVRQRSTRKYHVCEQMARKSHRSLSGR